MHPEGTTSHGGNRQDQVYPEGPHPTERTETGAEEKCEEGAGVLGTYYNPRIPLHRSEWERQGSRILRNGIKQIQQLC